MTTCKPLLVLFCISIHPACCLSGHRSSFLHRCSMLWFNLSSTAFLHSPSPMPFCLVHTSSSPSLSFRVGSAPLSICTHASPSFLHLLPDPFHLPVDGTRVEVPYGSTMSMNQGKLTLNSLNNFT